MKTASKENPSHHHQPRPPAALRITIVAYLVICLIVTGLVAFETWPDNTLRPRSSDLEIERLAVLQITADEVEILNQAIVALAQLPLGADETLSGANLELIVRQRAFAEALVELEKEKASSQDASDENPSPSPAEGPHPRNELSNTATPKKNEPSSPPTSNPKFWTRGDVLLARTDLLAAKRILERRPRTLALQDPYWDGGPAKILVRAILPISAKKSRDPLACLPSSERAQVEDLVSAISRPEKAAEDANNPKTKKLHTMLNGIRDGDFVLLIVALGALGAAAQALASVANFVGENRFKERWTLFYFTRPILGACLALAFYVVFRGGLATQRTTWEEINHIGYAAIAILVGICSSEAMENLREIAAAFFRPKSEVDGLKSQDPMIKTVIATATEIEIHGIGFAENYLVTENETPSPRSWTRRSSELLTTSATVAMSEGTSIRVINIGENGGRSESVRFSAKNPANSSPLSEPRTSLDTSAS